MGESIFPGVIVDETSFRSRPIEGVPTGGAGFVGRTARGTIGEVRRVRSLPEFEAAFGGPPAPLAPEAPIAADDFMWRASRAFFEEGGKRLAIVRTASAASDPPTPDAIAQALGVLEAEADIEIVAAPGSTVEDNAPSRAVAEALVDHARRMTHRLALIDGPKGADITAIEAFRAPIDSSRAALYYPWVRTADGVLIPPSGIVAGIIAANDAERGVWKAPANMVVKSAIGFETSINEAVQEQLNPQGINCFRTFTGRGHRLWGARTLSRDPEWKYIHVRRLMSFVEHSIELGARWTVFEPNGEALWAMLHDKVDAFLTSLWRDDALMGSTTREAFFVRCDRTTMTQADIDAGRVIVEIGVAPVRPAEFVIVRILLCSAPATD